MNNNRIYFGSGIKLITESSKCLAYIFLGKKCNLLNGDTSRITKNYYIKNTISIRYCWSIMENQSTRANCTNIWNITAVYNDKVKQNVKVDI